MFLKFGTEFVRSGILVKEGSPEGWFSDHSMSSPHFVVKLIALNEGVIASSPFIVRLLHLPGLKDFTSFGPPVRTETNWPVIGGGFRHSSLGSFLMFRSLEDDLNLVFSEI